MKLIKVLKQFPQIGADLSADLRRSIDYIRNLQIFLGREK
jgi:hypothetical protein